MPYRMPSRLGEVSGAAGVGDAAGSLSALQWIC